MDEKETVVFEFVSGWNRNRSVSDATYSHAVKMFGEKGVVDMIGLEGYYRF
jgi:4-carboxymuconolactone decarboxylase